MCSSSHLSTWWHSFAQSSSHLALLELLGTKHLEVLVSSFPFRCLYKALLNIWCLMLTHLSFQTDGTCQIPHTWVTLQSARSAVTQILHLPFTGSLKIENAVLYLIEYIKCYRCDATEMEKYQPCFYHLLKPEWGVTLQA